MLEFDGKRDKQRRQAAENGLEYFIMPDGTVHQPKEFRKTMTTWAVQVPVPFTVDTLEGMHTGDAGDYLAIGPAGEMYPIKEDIFLKTYEAVDNVDK